MASLYTFFSRVYHGIREVLVKFIYRRYAYEVKDGFIDDNVEETISVITKRNIDERYKRRERASLRRITHSVNPLFLALTTLAKHCH